MAFFATFKTLKENGILGMNERNVNYISKYNDRRLYPLVDDKLQTKLLAQKMGITTPNLFFTIAHQHDVKKLSKKLEPLDAFVIKPSRGSGGKGILVIKSKTKEGFVKTNDEIITIEAIMRHVTNILSGLYSLSSTPDVAIFEDLVIANSVLKKYSYQGVPDIRIIVFRGYPIMAMLRLSTKSSDGKANLHQGAVGVGIDIKSAKAISAVQEQTRVYEHPDTKNSLDNIELENWKELLELSARCYDMTKLGYLGVDIVLDEKRGPMLLELNARPGLSIQVANSQGLLPRLREIEKIEEIAPNAKERVSFVLDKNWV
jgi:alpha-L-glutamate ligase-like protein